jgi:hypothetical protein
MNMKNPIEAIEKQRLALQADLDSKKTQAERNRLGQFATPTALATDILQYAVTLFGENEKIRFLDPAIGTGAFYSALRRVLPARRIIEALGFDIDPHYENPASKLWAKTDLVIRLADFTKAEPSSRFNLIICNPPYVRHHHLENGNKLRLQSHTYRACGVKFSGLAGLYCHFLGLSHAWMTEGGIAGWLIPSEFMDVNYGRAVKRYLLEKVTLLHIHRFDPSDVQFTDALVSSAVVWFKKAAPPVDHSVTFTLGGSLLAPRESRIVLTSDLLHESKWTRFPSADIRTKKVTPVLFDFFKIKRGLATGENDFFILSAEEIKARDLPMEVFRPILPSPRYLPTNEVAADPNGLPSLDRQLFLLDTRLTEDEIKVRFPALFSYLQDGKSRKVSERYLCQHRDVWYSQENRPPAPIVCTYLGRGDSKSGRPFRFILNHSKATVANVYLAMYPTELLEQAIKKDSGLIRRVWEVLNCITPGELLGEGRVYGGGLHKLEPKELANVDATAIGNLIPDFAPAQASKQLGLFTTGKMPANNAFNTDAPKRRAG